MGIEQGGDCGNRIERRSWRGLGTGQSAATNRPHLATECASLNQNKRFADGTWELSLYSLVRVSIVLATPNAKMNCTILGERSSKRCRSVLGRYPTA